MNHFAWLLFFCLCLAAPLAQGQENTGPLPLCSICKTTGKLPNPFYEEHCQLEEKVKFCSWRIEHDKEGCGIPWLPCWKCKNPELKAKAIEEFEKEVAKRKAWLAKRREIDAFLKVKKPLFHLQTEHYLWAWSIPKLKSGKQLLKAHEALHLFAERMEAFYAEFQKVHRITDRDNVDNLHNLFIFEKQKTAIHATGKYTLQNSATGRMARAGNPSVYVTWWNKRMFPDEEDLHCDLIHICTHLCTAAYMYGYWSYEMGVAYEGMAHWWEFHMYGHSVSYCVQESDLSSDWITDDWRSQVRKLILTERAPSLSELITKNGGMLDHKEHMLGWSMMDFMMSMDTKKTLNFIREVKTRAPRDAFRDIWGWSVPGFEERWHEYVKEQYTGADDLKPILRRRRR